MVVVWMGMMSHDDIVGRGDSEQKEESGGQGGYMEAPVIEDDRDYVWLNFLLSLHALNRLYKYDII